MPHPLMPVLAAIILSLAGCTACPDPITRAPLPPAEQLSTTDIDNLSWLAGTWRGTGLGGNVEEVFLKPFEGTMPAVFRRLPLNSSDPEDTPFYEFILLEENTVNGRPANITYTLHHFSPGMNRWEDEPVVFELTALETTDARTTAEFTKVGDGEGSTTLIYNMGGEGASYYVPGRREMQVMLRETDAAGNRTFPMRLGLVRLDAWPR